MTSEQLFSLQAIRKDLNARDFFAVDDEFLFLAYTVDNILEVLTKGE